MFRIDFFSLLLNKTQPPLMLLELLLNHSDILPWELRQDIHLLLLVYKKRALLIIQLHTINKRILRLLFDYLVYVILEFIHLFLRLLELLKLLALFCI